MGIKRLLPTMVLAVGVCSGGAAIGQGISEQIPPDQGVSGNSVYLDDAALAQLRRNNPGHYARGLQVMNAANELCKPGPALLTYARADARQIGCSRMLLRTSNPPKREISF